MNKHLTVKFTVEHTEGEYYEEGFTFYADTKEIIFGGERRGSGRGAIVVQEGDYHIHIKEAIDWLTDILTNIAGNYSIKVINEDNRVLIDMIQYQED